jgi:alpha-L-rhamnosidase
MVMKLLKKLIIAALMAVSFGVIVSAAEITNLMVDRREAPLGIGNKTPEFSWEMVSEERGAFQSAYQIVVVNDTSGKTVWNSGKVESDISNGIKYEGDDLESATRYSYTVTVWDKNAEATEAVSSHFETGYFDRADWSGADFIAPYTGETPTNYSIEFDFRIESVTAGFVFGGVDTSHFLMWQVSSYNYGTNTADWKMTVRPHVWNGNVTCITEIDISNIIPIENAYKTHKMKLEIKGNTVYTYIDGVKLDWTYTSDYASFGKIGFREVSNGTVYSEAAYFDNIFITDDNSGTVIYSNNFNENAEPFTSGSLINGELR